MNDWSQYSIDEPEANEQVSQQSQISSVDQQPVNWDQYAVGKPSVAREVGRHATRLTSRVGETIGGFPGGSVQLAKAAGDWLENKVPLPSFLKGTEKANAVQKYGQQLIEKLPTSEDLKQLTSKITNGFTDPQSAAEQFGDDIIELATVLYGDKSKAPAKAQKVVTNTLIAVGKAFGAKTSKEVAKAYGVGEKGQFFAEMGTLGLMSLINVKMAREYANDKISKAREMIPPNQMINTNKLTQSLDTLEAELSKGLSTATKNEVKGAVSEIKGKVSGGAYPAGEVLDIIHDVNERMSSKKLFDELSSTEKRKLQFRYNKLKTPLFETASQISNTQPEAYKLWLEGMEASATVKQSQRATRFLERHVGKLPAKVGQGIAIELFLGQPQAAMATAGAFAALKGGELMYRVMNSPSLRKHYTNILTAATKENIPAMTKELTALENGLQKSIVNDLSK